MNPLLIEKKRFSAAKALAFMLLGATCVAVGSIVGLSQNEYPLQDHSHTNTNEAPRMRWVVEPKGQPPVPGSMTSMMTMNYKDGQSTVTTGTLQIMVDGRWVAVEGAVAPWRTIELPPEENKKTKTAL